jgi:hypothetical protein
MPLIFFLTAYFAALQKFEGLRAACSNVFPAHQQQPKKLFGYARHLARSGRDGEPENIQGSHN